MKRTQTILMSVFVGLLTISILWVILAETGAIETGQFAMNAQQEFLQVAVMEIATLGSVFLALRLFKFKAIHKELVEQKEQALLKWGLIRLVLLELPMLSNTLFYYQFMNTTFGYMAIIQLLCLPFVVPTMGRCLAEVEEE